MYPPSSDYNPQYPQPMSCARKAAFAFTIVLMVLQGAAMICSMVSGDFTSISGMALGMIFCVMGITGIQRKNTCLMMAYIVYLIIAIVCVVIAIGICILVATVITTDIGPSYEDSSYTNRADFDAWFTMVMAIVIGLAVVSLVLISLTLYYTIKARKEILAEGALLPGQNPYPLPYGGPSPNNYGWTPQKDEWTPGGNVTVQQSDRSDWTAQPSQQENESADPSSPYDTTHEA